jgi:hypothetical protein
MGKTPAFMRHYDVRFANFEDIRGREIPARPVDKRFPYDDRFGADQKKADVDIRPVDPVGSDVAYGAIWYLDWDMKEHCFRFILRIDPNRDTRPDISEFVHPDYSKWD